MSSMLYSQVQGRALVANTITLQNTGRLSRVACDQEWIADYIMGQALPLEEEKRRVLKDEE